jgi:hypothetical protein
MESSKDCRSHIYQRLLLMVRDTSLVDCPAALRPVHLSSSLSKHTWMRTCVRTRVLCAFVLRNNKQQDNPVPSKDHKTTSTPWSIVFHICFISWVAIAKTVGNWKKSIKVKVCFVFVPQFQRACLRISCYTLTT